MAERHFRPLIATMDVERAFPNDAPPVLAEMGAYGLPLAGWAILHEEVACVLPGLGIHFQVNKEASMAKPCATECVTHLATKGMQVLGGYSYTKEFEMERFYREAKLYEVAGESTQVPRNIIAKQLGIPDSEQERKS